MKGERSSNAIMFVIGAAFIAYGVYLLVAARASTQPSAMLAGGTSVFGPLAVLVGALSVSGGIGVIGGKGWSRFCIYVVSVFVVGTWAFYAAFTGTVRGMMISLLPGVVAVGGSYLVGRHFGVERPRPDRSIRALVLSICATGFLLPSFWGMVVRAVLVARGVAVVSWSQGAALIGPLTILFLFPWIFFALLTNSVLSTVNRRNPREVPKWLHMFLAGFIGLTLTFSFLLIDLLQDVGETPLFLAMFPFTVFVPLLLGAGGVVLGALAGWLVWLMRAKVRKEGPRDV